MADTQSLLSYAFTQSPYFVLLLALWYIFYKFQERTYGDYKQQITDLQKTFTDSLWMITNTFGGRLDKIEDTLEKINK